MKSILLYTFDFTGYGKGELTNNIEMREEYIEAEVVESNELPEPNPNESSVGLIKAARLRAREAFPDLVRDMDAMDLAEEDRVLKVHPDPFNLAIDAEGETVREEEAA